MEEIGGREIMRVTIPKNTVEVISRFEQAERASLLGVFSKGDCDLASYVIRYSLLQILTV